jgi:hypothetical protein
VAGGSRPDLARLAALAPAHPELAIDLADVNLFDGDRLGAAEAAVVGQGQQGSVPPARVAES